MNPYKDFKIQSQYVLVEAIVEHTSKGGIVIPDISAAKDETLLGKIVSLGPGQISTNCGEHIPMSLDLVIGSIIWFPKYGCHRCVINGVRVIAVQNFNIIAVVPEDMKIVVDHSSV